MKNTKVTIKVNKKTYTAKTNSKGVATFQVKHSISDNILFPTEYNDTATFKFAGDAKYHSSEVKVNLHVTDSIMYDLYKYSYYTG